MLLLPGGMCSARSYARGDGRALPGARPGCWPSRCRATPERRRRRTTASRTMRGSPPSSPVSVGCRPRSSASAWARQSRTRWWSQGPSRPRRAAGGQPVGAGRARLLPSHHPTRLGPRDAACCGPQEGCGVHGEARARAARASGAAAGPTSRGTTPATCASDCRRPLRWLHRDDDPARRLCEAGMPAWVVHAEKGGWRAHCARADGARRLSSGPCRDPAGRSSSSPTRCRADRRRSSRRSLKPTTFVCRHPPAGRTGAGPRPGRHLGRRGGDPGRLHGPPRLRVRRPAALEGLPLYASSGHRAAVHLPRGGRDGTPGGRRRGSPRRCGRGRRWALAASSPWCAGSSTVPRRGGWSRS